MKSKTPHRRWYQFSLRSLLFVTALAGFFLAPLSIKMKYAADQRGKVASILEAGGIVRYHGISAPTWAVRRTVWRM